MTAYAYNQTRRLFAAGQVSFADLKVMLLGAGATFDATHTDIAELSSHEVSGNGWAAGGETLVNAQVVTTDTNGALLTAEDIEKIATGGPIGPAYDAVIYDEDSGSVLFYQEFGGAREAPLGDPFIYRFNPSGIHAWWEPD